MGAEHTIQGAAHRSGLTPHTIRAWERRYAALTPQRTRSNRRLYTDEEIERLLLLRRAVEAGYTISCIAGLATAELRLLSAASPAPEAASEPPEEASPEALLDEALLALGDFDPGVLSNLLARATPMLGTAAMMERLVLPLLHRIGEGWRDGSVRIASEHQATVVLRTHLLRALGSLHPPASAPCLLVTTPAGQHHEFGALLAALTAGLEGWRVLYLGTNLPAEEIAWAARRSGAAAIALSIVYPPDDPVLPDELLKLREYLGGEVPVLIGGRQHHAYRPALAAIGAVTPCGLDGLRAELETIQARRPGSASVRGSAPGELG